MADTNTLNHGAHPAAVGASYAAAFAGISLRNFYRQVELARLPRGRKLGGRTVWLIAELQGALEALPVDQDDAAPSDENPWDGASWQS